MTHLPLSSSFSSVKVGVDNLEISVLQFANDTLMFGDATLENVLCMKSAPRCFELVSGLKLNFQKSKLGVICVKEAVIEMFASLLNCRMMEILFVFLGIPIGVTSQFSMCV